MIHASGVNIKTHSNEKNIKNAIQYCREFAQNKRFCNNFLQVFGIFCKAIGRILRIAKFGISSGSESLSAAPTI